MKWIELKTKVRNLLLDRNLANPNIRLNALERLEKLIKSNFPQIYNNPTSLLEFDKDDFKIKLSKYKKLNSAESSVINNFYQILDNTIPIRRNSRKLNSPKTKNRNNKPEIVLTCEELLDPLYGIEPIVDGDTKILILGTFPAKKSIDADFYYQNQIKRFWGQALSYIGLFEYISNEERKILLLKRKIGLWDIFECAIREGSNQDKSITKAKYNNIEDFLNNHPSIEYLIFNGSNSYNWLQEDIPSIFNRGYLKIKHLQSSSGGNGHFNYGKDWEEYFQTIGFLSTKGT